MLGGELNWQGLPVVCEILGIGDIEALVAELVIIRNFQEQQRAAEMKR